MPDIVKTVGSRVSVFHGNAKHTSGGLKKQDLRKNKNNEIVAKAASDHSKKLFKQNPKMRKQSKETLLIMSGLPTMTLQVKSKLLGRQITEKEVVDTRRAAKQGVVPRRSERLPKASMKKATASKKAGSSKSKK